MQCTQTIRLTKNVNRSLYPDGMEVPCGRCYHCRVAIRREWSVRMMHELHYHDDATFLTLTYSDEYLPARSSIVKDDLVKFFKRLRRTLSCKIRYYACGEYGRKTQRPHYHAIIFSLNRHRDFEHITRAWRYCDWNNSAVVEGSLGLVEAKSIAYVAGYIEDKLENEQADAYYRELGREAPFRLSSKGLGRSYVDQYSEQIMQRLSLTVNGVEIPLPRYYLKRLGITPDMLIDRRIEHDCELTEHRTGIYMQYDDLYRTGDASVRMYYDAEQSAKRQSSRDIEARITMRKREL